MSLVTSIQQVLGNREDRGRALASLVDLRDNGSVDTTTQRAFQYYPETINVSRSVDWQEKRVIGGSHPLYQWIAGSARSFGFEAVFTSEDRPPSGNRVGNTIQLVESAIKNPLGTAIAALKKNSNSPYTVDVAAAAAWLQSKTYPTYKNRIAAAPPKMLLVLPNSGITTGIKGIQVDSIPVIMASCNIVYETMFRTGHPRIIVVSLEFHEIVQTGRSGWGYADRKEINKSWNTIYNNRDTRNPAGALGNAGKFIPQGDVPEIGNISIPFLGG